MTREAQVKGMRRCKISEILVFVPTYNSEKYLRECLDSVLHQTFHDWECVISDDASTDKSVEIAREYEKKDSRFRVLTHEKMLVLRIIGIGQKKVIKVLQQKYFAPMIF